MSCATPPVCCGAEVIFCGRGTDESDAPVPGQFYMLKAEHWRALLGRPISLYNVRRDSAGGILSDVLTADFLAQRSYAAVYACRAAPMLDIIDGLRDFMQKKAWIQLRNYAGRRFHDK